MDDESLVRICKSAFKPKIIENSKNLLFDSVSTTSRKITRKRDGKSERDLEDIITLIRETAVEKLPIFVARDLQNLPPVSFDHVDVTKLLKDIVLMQKEIKCLKDQYVTSESFDLVKRDLENLKHASIVNNFPCTSYVNSRRGAFLDGYSYDSGPMGLQTENVCANLISENSNNKITDLPTQQQLSHSHQPCAQQQPTSLAQRPAVTEKTIDVTTADGNSSHSYADVSVSPQEVWHSLDVHQSEFSHFDKFV
ncbi:unnamed protein product [Plutella xylostella]|uniref:(diamondback moth) hypothetical protein n=1 Tax=Plutella xylostella TaxID=51655 RepID=A0A8S4GAE6_PLUXY|nr:unnamed protein product [Plutella xylostella]